MPPSLPDNNLLHSIVEQLTKLFELTSRIDTKAAVLESDYSKINTYLNKLSDSYNSMADKITKLEISHNIQNQNLENKKKIQDELKFVVDDLKELERTVKDLEAINTEEKQQIEIRSATKFKIALTIISNVARKA